MAKSPKELSIFIDESGDFGAYDPKYPYYIISMVFHNQADDMSDLFQSFDRALSETMLQRNFVRMGPLIRREYEYTTMSIEERHILGDDKMINKYMSKPLRKKKFIDTA